MDWFRFYSETLHDPKLRYVQRATHQSFLAVFGAWVSVLSLANDSPIRGSLMLTDHEPLDDELIAEELHVTVTETVTMFQAFVSVGMLEKTDGVWRVTNWSARQYESDTSTERVQRYRNNRRKLGMPAGATYDSEMVLSRDGKTCVYCGDNKNLCVDHALPIKLGGDDNDLNLVCACKACNSGKAGRTPEQAGYSFRNKEAQKRYECYRDTCNPATVSVTHQIQSTDTDTEKQTRAFSPVLLAYQELFLNGGQIPTNAKQGATAALIELQGLPEYDEAEAATILKRWHRFDFPEWAQKPSNQGNRPNFQYLATIIAAHLKNGTMPADRTKRKLTSRDIDAEARNRGLTRRDYKGKSYLCDQNTIMGFNCNNLALLPEIAADFERKHPDLVFEVGS